MTGPSLFELSNQLAPHRGRLHQPHPPITRIFTPSHEPLSDQPVDEPGNSG